MPALEMKPSALLALMDAADKVGFPHHFVAVGPTIMGRRVLQWERDGGDTGVTLTLDDRGDWSVTVDVP